MSSYQEVFRTMYREPEEEVGTGTGTGMDQGGRNGSRTSRIFSPHVEKLEIQRYKQDNGYVFRVTDRSDNVNAVCVQIIPLGTSSIVKINNSDMLTIDDMWAIERVTSNFGASRRSMDSLCYDTVIVQFKNGKDDLRIEACTPNIFSEVLLELDRYVTGNEIEAVVDMYVQKDIKKRVSFWKRKRTAKSH